MTEITGNCKFINVDLIAFTIALFGAPFVVAILGFSIWLIPVIAVPAGMLPYLIFGGPVLFLYLAALPYSHAVPTVLLVLVNTAVFAGDAPIAQTVLKLNPSEIELRLLFGSIFAPLWGVAFEFLYCNLRRPE